MIEGSSGEPGRPQEVPLEFRLERVRPVEPPHPLMAPSAETSPTCPWGMYWKTDEGCTAISAR